VIRIILIKEAHILCCLICHSVLELTRHIFAFCTVSILLVEEFMHIGPMFRIIAHAILDYFSHHGAFGVRVNILFVQFATTISLLVQVGSVEFVIGVKNFARLISFSHYSTS
jgi:hypothetical protein